MHEGKYKVIAYVLLISVILGIMAIYMPGHLTPETIQPPRAVEGVLDLREWNFEKNGVLSLEGECGFYWEQLLTPEDFAMESTVAQRKYTRIPGIWNGYKLTENGKEQKLPGDGYATYRLVIHTNTDEPILSLKLPDLATSYRLWVNGEILSENGKVGKNKNETQPQAFPRVVSF